MARRRIRERAGAGRRGLSLSTRPRARVALPEKIGMSTDAANTLRTHAEQSTVTVLHGQGQVQGGSRRAIPSSSPSGKTSERSAALRPRSRHSWGENARVGRATRGTPRGESMVRERFSLVVVAASAGGLDALSRILSQLPPTFPAALAIVQHRGLSYPHLLADILRQRTRLRVRNAEDGDEARPGIAYIAPPGVHLVVDARQRFTLIDGAKVKHARPSGDVLFTSAAEAFGPRVVALVLTGGDGDGSGGLSVVKEHGGTVISQDEASARDPSMPKAAIATGDVDYVLPLAYIASTLERLVRSGGMTSNALVG
jgi:two-component system, chemotaxis family, protein-glutamate methylesterase/glutaminase